MFFAPAELVAAILSALVVLPPSAASFDLSEHLRLVEEQPIESWPATGRTFRFIYVPAFPSRRIFSVRIQDLGDGPELVAKAATYVGEVNERIHRRLSSEEWENLREARQAGLWNFHPDEYPRRGYADGSTWILEGAAGGERLRVVQHIPRAGAFPDLCCEMFRLSGIRLTWGERHTQIACGRPTKRCTSRGAKVEDAPR